MDFAVREGDVPHHFDDLKPALLVEGALQDAGELVEIHRIAVALFGLFDEARGRGVVEPEALLDHRLEAPPLRLVGRAVGGGDMHEERSGGEPVIVFGEDFFGGARASEFGDKTLQRVEHRNSPGLASGPRQSGMRKSSNHFSARIPLI